MRGYNNDNKSKDLPLKHLSFPNVFLVLILRYSVISAGSHWCRHCLKVSDSVKSSSPDYLLCLRLYINLIPVLGVPASLWPLYADPKQPIRSLSS